MKKHTKRCFRNHAFALGSTSAAAFEEGFQGFGVRLLDVGFRVESDPTLHTARTDYFMQMHQSGLA